MMNQGYGKNKSEMNEKKNYVAPKLSIVRIDMVDLIQTSYDDFNGRAVNSTYGWSRSF